MNTAARLESLTRKHDHSIIITAAMFERLLASERAGFESLGDTKVKGKTELLTIYGTN